MVTLVVDVVLDLVLVAADCGDKVSTCPQRSLGELLGFLLQPARGLALQNLDDIGGRVLGWDGEEEVNVFVPNVPGMNVQLFPVCNDLEHAFELGFDIRVFEHLATVFRTPHNVVVADPGCMSLLIQASVVHREITVGW